MDEDGGRVEARRGNAVAEFFFRASPVGIVGTNPILFLFLFFLDAELHIAHTYTCRRLPTSSQPPGGEEKDKESHTKLASLSGPRKKTPRLVRQRAHRYRDDTITIVVS